MVWKCCLAPAARVSFKSLGGQAAFRCPTLVQKSAGMATRARARFQTVSPKRRTLKEIVMAPAGDGGKDNLSETKNLKSTCSTSVVRFGSCVT